MLIINLNKVLKILEDLDKDDKEVIRKLYKESFLIDDEVIEMYGDWRWI